MNITSQQKGDWINTALALVLKQGMDPNQPPEASDVAAALTISVKGVEAAIECLEIGVYPVSREK